MALEPKNVWTGASAEAAGIIIYNASGSAGP
jgi:hypothetical protein